VKLTAWISGGLLLLAGAGCGGPRPPAGSERPAPPAPTATGRIRGVVRLRGDAPPQRTENTGKDTNVCGASVQVTRLRVGKDSGVKQAFVYLDGIAVSGAVGPAASLTVEQKGCEYAPHAMTLAPGSPIEILNSDPILHNIHAKQMTDDGLQTVFNIAQPIRGQRTKVNAQMKPGIVALTCEAGHPWMTAYILVSNNPYVAVSADDGTFVIEGVPAGTYPIKMWHEGVSLKRVLASVQEFDYEDPYEMTQQVVVPADGEAKVEFEFALRPSNQQARAATPPF
jgi:plastocyanin